MNFYPIIKLWVRLCTMYIDVKSPHYILTRVYILCFPSHWVTSTETVHRFTPSNIVLVVLEELNSSVITPTHFTITVVNYQFCHQGDSPIFVIQATKVQF